jgi:hypothetical protein
MRKQAKWRSVRTGVAQIVITCVWSGSGDIIISDLTRSVTEIYYESDMNIYEKTTASFEGSATTFLNVKRASLLVNALASQETWILNLGLNDVTSYQVNVETS